MLDISRLLGNKSKTKLNSENNTTANPKEKQKSRYSMPKKAKSCKNNIMDPSKLSHPLNFFKI